MTREIRIGWTLMLCLSCLPALGGDTAGEIQYLLDSIGRSNCSFIRNGAVHGAAEAESHLRMKYTRGKSRISTADQFIEHIASKSSWTGNPYYIECPNTERQPAGGWLTDRLTSYRDKL
jgi:hypothetical protein